MLEHTAPYRPSEYLGVDGQLIKRLDQAPPPYRLGWAPNYVFDQPSVERELRRRLTELSSVEVRLSTEVVAINETQNGVTVHVTTADGSTTQCRAAWFDDPVPCGVRRCL